MGSDSSKPEPNEESSRSPNNVLAATSTVAKKNKKESTSKFDWQKFFEVAEVVVKIAVPLVVVPLVVGLLGSLEDPEQSKLNPRLFNIHAAENVTYSDLDWHDPEYQRITRMITNKQNFKVDGIQKIKNPFLEQAFQLKKAQKESQLLDVEEVLLFHGTKQADLDTICEMNFNWRLCKRNAYGRGISFSPNSTYASNYSDKNMQHKVIIVAKVLIGKTCPGNGSMELPPHGFDTTTKDDGTVIVKFEDNEFYPVYKIDYHLLDENVGRKHGSTKPNRGIATPTQQMRYIDSFHYNYDSY